ncbi:MAG: 50S ribosomal protein L28 [Planctomycetes bacterium]|nr:50S ribosomal protein L28 [Planctomycetota bacterium]
MSRKCDICGKRPSVGNQITRRGLAKKKGGVGKKITGIGKRRYLPNIQHMRAFVNGRVVRVKVCTGCLKAGKVQKPPVTPKKNAVTIA